jgi:hypothetical protein
LFSEFVVKGHHYTSPNQQKPPPTLSESISELLPDIVSPTELRNRVWAARNLPYLPFILNSPFHGTMTSRFATPVGQIPLVKGKSGYHLPESVAKSWKTLEQSLRTICNVLNTTFLQDHPKVFLSVNTPSKPSDFGYFTTHPTEETARTALSQSLDAFVILLACVSFYIAISRIQGDPLSISSSTSESKPRWLRDLADRKNRIHPEWLQLLADSPVANFTSGPQRLGGIVNVSRCSWLHLVPYMIEANVPLWFYWGIPPTLGQPLVNGVLKYAPISHPLRSDAPSLPLSQPVTAPSQPVAGPSQPVAARVPSGLAGPGQLLNETWKDFMQRQNKRRKVKLQNESEAQRRTREGREMTAVKRQCPGKKGPTVYIWEEDNDVWTRTLLSRGEVEGYWGQYRSSQKIYNSIDNCWDLCTKFDEGTAGEVEYEYDSNDSDDDFIPDRQKPAPHSVPMPAQVTSDCLPPMDVDPTPYSAPTPAQVAPDPPPMEVDPTPRSVPTTDQVALDPPLAIVDPAPLPASSPVQFTSDSSPMVVDLIPLPVSLPALVASDPLSMVGESTLPGSSPAAQVASDPPPTDVDPTPRSAPTTDQVASDPPPKVVDLAPLPVSSPAQVTSYPPPQWLLA